MISEKTVDDTTGDVVVFANTVVIGFVLIVMAMVAAQFGWIPDLLAVLLPFVVIGLSLLRLRRSAGKG